MHPWHLGTQGSTFVTTRRTHSGSMETVISSLRASLVQKRKLTSSILLPLCQTLDFALATTALRTCSAVVVGLSCASALPCKLCHTRRGESMSLHLLCWLKKRSVSRALRAQSWIISCRVLPLGDHPIMARTVTLLQLHSTARTAFELCLVR